VAWIDFEQGVRGTRAGKVAQLNQVRQSEGPRPERSFATLGQNKRPCEKQAKTGPAKDLSEKTDRFINQVKGENYG